MSRKYKYKFKCGDTVINTGTKKKGFVWDLSVVSGTFYVHYNMHPKNGITSTRMFRYAPCSNVLTEKL